MIASGWLGGGFLGMFLGIFYTFSLVFSIFLFVIALGSFLFFYLLRSSYFLFGGFFFLGCFWGIFNNAPALYETSDSSLFLKRKWSSPKVGMGADEKGAQFLLWGVSSLSFEKAYEPYLVSDRDLFYPLKSYVKREGFEGGRAGFFENPFSQGLKDYFHKKIKKHKELSPWLQSLLLGDRTDLSYKEHIVFSTLGLYHLLVLSGLHFTFLGFFLAFFFSFLIRVGYVARLINCGVFVELTAMSHVLVCSILFVYAQAVSFTAPVQRAFLGYILFTFFSFFSFQAKKVEFLLWLLSLQFLLFPMGFLGNSACLSWASFLTILHFLQDGKKALWWRVFRAQLFLTLAVSVCCGRFSLLGFFINPFIAPLFSLIYACSFLLVFDVFFPPFMISFFLELQSLFLLFLEKVAILPQWFSWFSIDLLAYPSSLRCFLLVLFGLFFCYLLKSIKEK